MINRGKSHCSGNVIVQTLYIVEQHYGHRLNLTGWKHNCLHSIAKYGAGQDRILQKYESVDMPLSYWLTYTLRVGMKISLVPKNV